MPRRATTKAKASTSTSTSKRAPPAPMHGTEDEGSLSELTVDSEGDEEESENSEDEQSSDEERSTKRPQKRVKRSTKARDTVPANAPTLFFNVPADIQLEILSWLAPKDLISIIRTSKYLRGLMLGKSSVRTWRLSRETQEVQVPEPPPGWSEPQWAVLLFDGTRCEGCAVPRVIDINFYLLKRICPNCYNEKNLIPGRKFEKLFPEYDKAILEMIPYLNAIKTPRSREAQPKLYWKSDIHDMASRWATFQDAIRKRVRDAKEKATDFHDARKELVETVRKRVPVHQAWHQRHREKREMEKAELGTRRRAQIIERFKELGYDAADIAAITWKREACQNRELTDRIWKRIRPILEPQIQKQQESRLVSIKRRGINEVYTEYMKSLAPSEWVHLPSVEDALELPLFKAEIQLDGEKGKSNNEELISLIPASITAWQDERKADMNEKVLAFLRTRSKEEVTDASYPDPVNLATSVFQCNGVNCSRFLKGQGGRRYTNLWFGWEGVLLHSCQRVSWGGSKRRTPGELQVFKGAYGVVTDLVELADLDPKTATVEDMDRTGLRYFCTSCPQRKGLVHDWRSAVTHGTSSDHRGRGATKPRWKQLTDEELEKVVPLADSKFFWRYWGCAHCNIHFQRYDTREAVQDHVKNIHAIDNPIQGEDIIFYPDRHEYEPPTQLCNLE